MITVIRNEPTLITVDDQSGDGTLVSSTSVNLPAPGFIELLADGDGAPSERIQVQLTLTLALEDE